ncbi:MULTISPECIES: TetR/AcrR family transcriptional regulator [Haladaptatus]|uniref:Transcriptional regulator, TetR family n=2 Tax=Haladaptatus paucihalophilus DX253 TaxID=797209 RepID=A0A1M6VQF3_HALPU|nr:MULTISPECIES: TetR/AcrR family transcriptional regulator [Haladaptatus]GKZ14106.1 TetR family transcriptional regulator [Haladaptatus sp. T7]SHK83787.1 transcriptional regulator, TetR family [Haladaptatus paucihalophilus DX253]
MKGFDDAERERIRDQLMETGTDLFARYGVKKTTISDLTDPVGIANGTFYRFFDSKEALYFEILQREGHETADDLIANSFETEDDPERAIRRFMTLLADEMEENPLFERLVAGDEWETVLRTMDGISKEEYESMRAASFAHLLPYVEAWQAEGSVRDGDPAAIVGVMGSVKFLTAYREQLGEEYYPVMRDTFVETVAAGLTRPTGENERV